VAPEFTLRRGGLRAIEAMTVKSFGERPGAAAPPLAADTASTAGTVSTGDVARPRDGASTPKGPDGKATARCTHSGIVIGRYQATVVVTVHGELDLPKAAHLSYVLADLIDGQGNLSLIVDLHDATAEAERVVVFVDAAERANRRGAAMRLSEPPALLHQALRQRGLDHLVGAH
jgi:anti-anti-sigma regulatory factor